MLNILSEWHALCVPDTFKSNLLMAPMWDLALDEPGRILGSPHTLCLGNEGDRGLAL